MPTAKTRNTTSHTAQPRATQHPEQQKDKYPHGDESSGSKVQKATPHTTQTRPTAAGLIAALQKERYDALKPQETQRKRKDADGGDLFGH